MIDKSAVLIGSGFGGLACAIRLQSAGIKVTLVEKRDKPGGRAYVYQDQGFTFDAGPTVITAPPCLEELFEISGRNIKDYVELLPVTPLYRLFWEDGVVFDYTNDLEKTVEQIKKLRPQDIQGYEEFLKYTEEVFEEGYTKLAHVPFLDWWSMIRVAPQLIRLEAYRTVYSMVSKFIKEPHLRQAFSFHSLLVGGNPFSTSSIYTLIHFLERKWGVYFPRGGTGALIKGLINLFQELGGHIRYDSEVKEILTENGLAQGVLLSTGEKIFSDLVVSNADVHHTYHSLLKREPLAESNRKKLDRSRYSMSLFVIYFGTNRKFPQFEHHNVVFGPRYKEHLADIFQKSHLADDFSLYVHRPTVTDPSLAPEGCDAFYALSPVPHLRESTVDWKIEGPRYGKKILDYLESRYLPGLNESIVTQRIFTPLDFQKELNAAWGSAFSLEPVLHQSAYFRTHNRDDKFSNLYFVGAGTHPGAGIPGVVGSAKATAQLILDDIAVRAKSLQTNNSSSVTASNEAKPDTGTLAQSCHAIIQNGSKSFSLASRLFEPEIRDAACLLYGWCRYVDDAIDESSEGKKESLVLNEIKQETELAFQGRPSQKLVFQALAEVAAQHQIPSYYAMELLEGMKMDCEGKRYQSFEELSLYCYRVASCVGLMMSHVMGLSDEGALKNASDLGMAMQLTNIARDIVTDAQNDRVYLPLSWLEEVAMSPEDVLNPAYRSQVAFLVKRLLKQADRYYQSGVRGLVFLPWRSSWAVALAACVYRQIGREVKRRGARAWDSRTVVSGCQKFQCALEAAVLVVRTLPYRLVKPWRRVNRLQIWRHQWIPAELS